MTKSRQIFTALVIWTVTGQVLAQQTTNTELRVVPSVGDVVVDGALDDWDLSAGIFMCHDIAALATTNSVWAYMMYDQETLYVAFHFKDRTPLVNHVNPQTKAGEAWVSDCMQIRLWTDQVINMDSHFYTDGKKPAVYMAYMDYGVPAEQQPNRSWLKEAIGHGVQAAFRIDKDGQGYTQELAFPWSMLRRDGKAYQAGQRFRCGLEPMWGDVTGGATGPLHRFADLVNPKQKDRVFFWKHKNAWGTAVLVAENNVSPSPTAKLVSAAVESDDSFTFAQRLALKRTVTSGPVELRYELPFDANVTLVIENETGKRIRNLIGDAFRPVGINVDYWDGADDEGRLTTPGIYRLRGLYHQPIVPTYEFAFGSPGNPPWETADGKGAWLADHTAPEAVAADAEQVYLASPYAEAGSAVIALDYSGKKQWGAKARFHGNSGAVLAVDARHLYVALDTPADGGVNNLVMFRLEKTTGALEPFADGSAYHVIDTYQRSLIPPPRSFADWIATGDHNADWNRCCVLGLACHADKIYLSSYLQNRILVIDCERGEMEKEIQIERPAGLAVDTQGRLMVVTGKQVMVVDVVTGKTQPLISSDSGGLQSPVALATDRQDKIYVSDWAREMCVKVYSRQGKFLRRIGKQGGRPWLGAWDQNGMLLPSGMAVDHQGRLWVAEKDRRPKRTSVWSSSGQFLREFIGPAFYKNVGTHVNPHDPTQAFVTGCELKLDWETGTSQPVATIWRATHPLSLFGPEISQHGSYRTIRFQGREFLISTTRQVVISERKGDLYQPLAALGHVEGFLHGYQGQALNARYREPRLPVPLLDAHRIQSENRHKIIDPDVWEYSHDAKTNFYWADHNGDALVQEEEIRFFETPGNTRQEWDFFFSVPVGEDLTIYPYARGGRPKIWRVAMQGWTPCGAPVYDPEKAEIVADWVRKPAPGMGNSGSWVFSGGRVLSIEAPLTLFDGQGNAQWSYPNDWPGRGSHEAPGARPGLLIGADFTLGEADLGGEVGTVFALRGGFGEDYLFTLDGLYIGSLFRDCRAAPESYPPHAVRGTALKDVTVAAAGEPYGGCLIQHPDTGKVYVIIGTEAPCICEIQGLDTIKRLPAHEIEFTRTHYIAAKDSLAQKVTEEPTPAVFKLTRTAVEARVDGDVGEWESTPSVARIYLDPNHTAQVRAAYDDNHLYLAYHVRDRMLLANGGKDWMMLYKTGSAVDFQIGVDPEANTGRTEPVEGDQRIVIAMFEGKPTAVLYRYIVPGASDPETFSSPIGTVLVDEVRRIDEARISVRQGDGEYTLEAAIPLAALHLQPHHGRKLRGDFGVIWSDGLGKSNAARCYWSNKAAGIVADLFSETKIDPNLWGEIEIVE